MTSIMRKSNVWTKIEEQVEQRNMALVGWRTGPYKGILVNYLLQRTFSLITNISLISFAMFRLTFFFFCHPLTNSDVNKHCSETLLSFTPPFPLCLFICGSTVPHSWFFSLGIPLFFLLLNVLICKIRIRIFNA